MKPTLVIDRKQAPQPGPDLRISATRFNELTRTRRHPYKQFPESVPYAVENPVTKRYSATVWCFPKKDDKLNFLREEQIAIVSGPAGLAVTQQLNRAIIHNVLKEMKLVVWATIRNLYVKWKKELLIEDQF
jgi:hypothetical protein